MYGIKADGVVTELFVRRVVMLLSPAVLCLGQISLFTFKKCNGA